MRAAPEKRIWTIGHSTRSLDEVCALLRAHDIEALVDVRSSPSSRHCPQWDRAAIVAALPDWLRYRWAPQLGGRRRPTLDSAVNGAWRNASFRGFADYMQGAAFAAGLDELLAEAGSARLAIMCSEAVWWRCHRSLIADALTARGCAVIHIMEGGDDEHHLRDFAAVRGLTVVYPAARRE
ncbi:MAG: DUF488 family protein [Candidatus Dormibacteraceae bacterium]